MNNLENLLDFYGLAGNKRAAALVESLLETLSELPGTEEPVKKPEHQFSTGVYELAGGAGTAYVFYDDRWIKACDNDAYVLHGVITRGGSTVGASWTSTGGYVQCTESDSDLVMPDDAGNLHVHYCPLKSDVNEAGYNYPVSIDSYRVLRIARDCAGNLPILRITYRGEKVVSAQLVNDWEIA